MIHGMAICAGGGGLELGLSLVLGDGYRVVCHVEREAYAAATLVKGMEEGALAQAPIWDDLDTFTGDVVSPFVGRVDLLSGGIPCQPHSSAGRQLGAADQRDLWPQTSRLIREVFPGGLLLENVPGIARYYWQRIRPELHDMGYATEEGIFSAAEIGASQLRERFFVLAYRDGEQGDLYQWAERAESVRSRHALADSRCGRIDPPQQVGVHRRGEPPVIGRDGTDVGHTGIQRRGKRRSESTRRGRQAQLERPSGAVADAESQGRAVRGGAIGTQPPVPGSEFDGGIFPPNPADVDTWARVLADMPALEPAFCRVAHGVAHRVDRLSMLGNGVVPLQAAYAFKTLLASMIDRMDGP